jgi:hypothetical protein
MKSKTAVDYPLAEDILLYSRLECRKSLGLICFLVRLHHGRTRDGASCGILLLG